MQHRTLFAAVVSIFSAFGVLGTATANEYPSQPIKLIVPTAPGGVADIVARIFAQKLNEAGKVAVVENKTGAGGAIAADFVVKSPPDGYTVYVGFHSTNAILPHLQKLNYNSETDFQPLTIAAKMPNVLVVNSSIPANTLSELIAYAKANAGKLTFASQGNGTTGHVVGEQFKRLAGIEISHVPYRGAAPAAQDLIAGHVSMLFDALTTALPHIQGGKVKALMVGDTQRNKLLPDVPTAAEAGLAELESGPWFGFFLPTGTPKPVVDWLYAEIKKSFNAPDVKEQFAKLGMTAVLGTPEETRAFVSGEYKRWGDVIRNANISISQ